MKTRILVALLSFVSLAIPAPAAHAAVASASSYQDYTANGATTVFSFTFPATSTSWVETLVGGVKQIAGVTVALNANQATSPGGTVTFLAAPANGASVRIQRTVPLTQELVLQPSSPFPSKTIEKTFDRLVMQGQQLDRTHAADKAAQTARDAAQDGTWTANFAAINGTSHEQSDLSSVLALGSTVPRNLAARFADTVNVKDFGAKGDGTTNDTAAIQAAIDSLLGGGVVQLPRGTYVVGGLTWRAMIHLVGAGRGVTVLRSSAAAPLVASTVTEIVGSIRDLTLDGNSTGTIGISLDGANRFALEDVEIKNFTATGALVKGATEWQAKRVKIINSVIGLKTELSAASSAGNLVTLDSCRFQGNTTYGADLSHGAVITIRDAEFGSNGTAGNVNTGALKIASMSDAGDGPAVIVASSWFESNKGHSAIRIGAPAAVPSSVTIRDTVILDAAQASYGVYASGAGVYYSATNVAAQGASVADFYDDDTIDRGALRDCVASSVSVGTRTTLWPHPAQAASSAFVSVRGAMRVPLLLGARQYIAKSASVSIDATVFGHFYIVAGDAAAFTVANPTLPAGDQVGRRIVLQFNASGGGTLGDVTFGAQYKIAGANPWVVADGSVLSKPANGKSRTIEFIYDGTNWVEVSRTPADVPN